jgi:hypothetical protein
MSLSAAQSKLEPMSDLSQKRTWVDIVKSNSGDMKRLLYDEIKREYTSQKNMGQAFELVDKDEDETQANSSPIESEWSDSESSMEGSVPLNPESTPSHVDFDEFFYSELAIACTRLQTRCARLRDDVPLFVPTGMAQTKVSIAPTSGLCTSL